MALWEPTPRSPVAAGLHAAALAKAKVRPFTAEDVIRAARKRTGLDDLGGEDFVPRLEVLVRSIQQEARLHAAGSVSTGFGMPTDMVRARLELQAARTRHPEIFERRIERPIFVVGGSRTGTTLIQRLLANEPRLRTPRLWELSSPRTFALGTDEERAQLRNRVDIGQKMLHLLNPTMRAVHDSEADGPEECVVMMGSDVRNWALQSCMNTPAYGEMLAGEDFRESYLRHRWQLQLLEHGVRTREGEGRRWLLKAPYHLPVLEALAEAYPHACIVHTHRDVVQAVTSTASLYCVFRSTFSDAVDPLEVGRQLTDSLSSWFVDTVAARQRLAGTGVRFLDVHYANLVADPLATAERILSFAGLEPTDEGRAAMSDWLSANRQHRHGGHRYTPGEFGLDPEAIRERMSAYRAAFGVD